ncbi:MULTISPECIES: glycosyltransferase [unclassified Azospirillum]|uniref:glycosyltransferase n=1 Tax=unclassified Azospirillum TaxID=2630922 RepID=UPI000B687CB3|nr:MULTISPECIES: glycosyltransferase [unclassified Azospirillum]SNT17387.1 Glycosyltransferase involved in cell wall bisynthesis [Azospirillum sp. RU38E]SNT29604.1 Glycosyltransferase involved in cell wall bisynthesis [Azospirillum sp. RU37A]
MYKVLFLHKLFPAQFVHLATKLASVPGVRVTALASDFQARLTGVEAEAYHFVDRGGGGSHPYLFESNRAIWRGQAVLAHCAELSRAGYRPDLIIGHNGWGEILFLKDLWPAAALIGYFEFFYRGQGADIGFDPEEPFSLDDLARVKTMNTINLLGLDTVDAGVSPTAWQKQLYPTEYQPKLTLIHDGIDTERACAGPARPLVLPDGRRLGPDVPIVTYVARDLEPYRGFRSAMRAAVDILQRRTDAHMVFVGGDGISYGNPPPGGGTWRARMLAELDGKLPTDRVHFIGKVPHAEFINLMRLSRVHLYLTYPFVLSWSMLEAMATGVTLVASATPPVQEVVEHGHNGLLVPFADPAAIAEGVLQALAMQADHRLAMRRAARKTVVDRYDLHWVALPAWMQLLRDRFHAPV